MCSSNNFPTVRSFIESHTQVISILLHFTTIGVDYSHPPTNWPTATTDHPTTFFPHCTLSAATVTRWQQSSAEIPSALRPVQKADRSNEQVRLMGRCFCLGGYFVHLLAFRIKQGSNIYSIVDAKKRSRYIDMEKIIISETCHRKSS